MSLENAKSHTTAASFTRKTANLNNKINLGRRTLKGTFVNMPYIFSWYK